MSHSLRSLIIAIALLFGAAAPAQAEKPINPAQALATQLAAKAKVDNTAYNTTTYYTIVSGYIGGLTNELTEVTDPVTQEVRKEFRQVTKPFTKITRNRTAGGHIYFALRKPPTAQVVSATLTWLYYICESDGYYRSWLPGDDCDGDIVIAHRLNTYLWGGQGKIRYIDWHNLRVLESVTVELYDSSKPTPDFVPCTQGQQCKGGPKK